MKNPSDKPKNLSETTERVELTNPGEPTEVTFKERHPEKFQKQDIPHFIVVEGDFLGEIYPADREAMTLGRSRKCEICLPDPSVSRKHARLERVAGEYLLKDLDSTNGILLNGQRVSESALKDGDKVQLGNVILRFGYQDRTDENYHQKLRAMAIRDGLTKVFNKGYFLDALKKEMSFAMRSGTTLAVVILDIDDFKKINDTYGHTVGDMVLRTIAASLEGDVRGYDVFARYGGEEFVFLIRNISAPHTRAFCERVRKQVETCPFTIDGKPARITISVGYAVLTSEQGFATTETFIAEADKYLYQAKREGKNRVCGPA